MSHLKNAGLSTLIKFTVIFRVRIQRVDSFLFKVTILFNKNNMGSTKRMGIQK